MGNEEVQQRLRAFVEARDWKQFHTPENLAKSISIEAAELLECFQWESNADQSKVREELADVLTYAFLLADQIGVAPQDLIIEKLALTEAKYPVAKAKGSSLKYDQL